MKAIERIVWLITVSLSLTACGKTIDWKQEVKLHDGRVIVVDRLSKISGTVFPENVTLEFEQTLTFRHPDSGERIEWKLPQGLQPISFDFDRGTPYYVLRAHTVADYNNWGCPNPPYLVYRFQHGNWSAVAFGELPPHFGKRNVLSMSKYIKNMKDGRTVSPREVEAVIDSFDPEIRTVSRERVSPIAKGCEESTLIRQGRQSEIDNRR